MAIIVAVGELVIIIVLIVALWTLRCEAGKCCERWSRATKEAQRSMSELLDQQRIRTAEAEHRYYEYKELSDKRAVIVDQLWKKLIEARSAMHDLVEKAAMSIDIDIAEACTLAADRCSERQCKVCGRTVRDGDDAILCSPLCAAATAGFTG